MRLGSYEILDLIGEGGMGEVYRAFDSRLKRAVAIKILPDAMADEPERISRFEREAEVLASLNHTNIATIHDFQREAQRRFIVMELVDGQTLTERLQRGPLPIDETLQIARQIADALDSAHQKGIIHRDLKPANIKIAADGKVKVLDFGLAKIFEKSERSLTASNSPTAIGNTENGVILGTVAYMSPEQARGKPVDKRTDIWALGCVVYEMLTGKQAFAGDNASDTIAAILREEPDWQALPAGTPHRIRLLLERCLRKDSRQRLSDAADARIEIEDAAADANTQAGVPVPSAGRRSATLVLAVLAGVALAGVFAWIVARTSSEAPSPIHLSFALPLQTMSIMDINANHRLAISPDGRKIVYEANLGDKRQLFLRFLGEPEGKLIEGTTDARNPFFSPDSEWIAFGQGQQLQKVAVSGGSPVTICKLSGTAFYGGDWGSDNTIIFVPDVNGGLWSVSANGGTPQPILKTDVARDTVSFSDPQVLPAGKGILFTLTSAHASTIDDLDVAVLTPGSSEPRILIKGGYNPRYVPSGQIIYPHDGMLLSVGFDLSKLTVTGTPVSVAGGVAKAWGGSNYSVSGNGTLVYEPDSGIKSGRSFAIVDLKGNRQPVPIPSGNFDEFSVSPDGRFLAGRVFSINDDIWVYNIATGIPLRLTFGPLDEIFPQWTPDGKRIAYGTRTGKIFWKPSDGTGQEEELTRGENPRYPVSFSPDGKLMAFVEIHPSRRQDIWVMPLEGNRQPQELVATDADEKDARFSPDGHWLAYVSDEAGKDEIFIRPIGAAGGRRQLSSEGGTMPVWSPDGRAIFFMKGDQLAKISLDRQGGAAHEQVLFTVQKFKDMQIDPGSAYFDIMPDGQHFVFEFGGHSASPTTHYTVVLNWFTELKQRMGGSR
jgi:serine/threonine protein kinase/Tol biopolymer transport system component